MYCFNYKNKNKTKSMIDYSKTVIYKLYCKDETIKEVYVGYSTNIKDRISVHRRVCIYDNHKSHNQNTYRFIREHGGWTNWTYDILEEFSCTSKEEAKEKEREWFGRFEGQLLNTNR